MRFIRGQYLKTLLDGLYSAAISAGLHWGIVLTKSKRFSLSGDSKINYDAEDEPDLNAEDDPYSDAQDEPELSHPITGKIGRFLRTLKPTIALLFYPAALMMIYPEFAQFHPILGFIRWITGGVIGIPHEVGHFIVTGVMITLSLLHIVFDRLLFSFFAVLAGSLGYTIPPLILAIHYFRKKDWFGAGAYLGFLAVALLNMSQYAQSTTGEAYVKGGPDQLLAPGIHHDWYWMLSYFNALDSAYALSTFFSALSVLAAVLSLLLLMAHIFFWISALPAKIKKTLHR